MQWFTEDWSLMCFFDINDKQWVDIGQNWLRFHAVQFLSPSVSRVSLYRGVIGRLTGHLIYIILQVDLHHQIFNLKQKFRLYFQDGTFPWNNTFVWSL